MRSSGIGSRLVLGLGAVVLILLQACPSDGGRRGGGLTSVNSKGEPTFVVESFDTLLLGLTGVEPKERYEFRATSSADPTNIVGQATLTANRRGEIDPFVLLYDIGSGATSVGSYDVTVTGAGINETRTVDIVPATGAYVYTCDSQGTIKNSFGIGDPIFVSGGNFPPNTEVLFAVVNDRPEYRDGDTVIGIHSIPGLSGRETKVVTDANGDIPVTQMLDLPLQTIAGEGFDIVADLVPYQIFDEGQDAADGHAVVGFTFQIPDVGTDIDAQIASDETGLYKDTFGPDEDVHAWINPPIQYVVQHGYVDKYVVQHRDEWKDGDVLQDVSGGNEMDGVQSGCTNEYIVVVYPGPLTAGDYDVIIDVNQDGVYTQGVDIVDGGSAESFGKIGFTVQ